MKFVITGGHHNSALVVAKELISQGHQVEWIGHKRAAAGDKNNSAEYVEVSGSHIPFHNLVAGKTAFSLTNFINVPLGLIRARKMLSRISPDAVISFGGYLGLAVSTSAYLSSIPVFLHEQTCIAGKANKFVARFARKVYLTWESSLSYYPTDKSLVIGLPLRETFIKDKPKKLFTNSKPTLLFLCGKQGSHIINKLVFANIEQLLHKYNLVHQTGTSSVTGDYEQAMALKSSLPPNLSDSYLPYGYIGENEIGVLVKSADLVIGRSGAHSTYELGVIGKKCILIPFLSTHGREQLHNARLLEKNKIAKVLSQSDLSYPHLEHEITLALARTKPDPLPLPLDASSQMISSILVVLSPKA